MLGVFALLLAAGCATGPYRYGGAYCTDSDAPLKPGEEQIERGRRAPVIDTVGWVVGIPGKIFMFDRRVDNHDISPETEACIEQYLADNHLDKVKVRINEYDPVGEWQRLRTNKSVAWPIRYTVGTLWVAGYALLPGRILGGDDYNPFTNTINLYSDVPAVALYQAGYAKDYAQRTYKGLYAVGYAVPGLGLWQEIQAADDALRYIRENGAPADVKAGYHGIYPMFGYRALSPFSVGDMSLSLPGLVGGHVVGVSKSAAILEAESTAELTEGPQESENTSAPVTASTESGSPEFRVQR